MSTRERLLLWLDKELRKAEHALLARQQSKQVWSTGDEQHWQKVCKASGTRYLNKEERLEIAKREERIAQRATDDVKNIKELIKIVNEHSA